jgi:hypothetical protein
VKTDNPVITPATAEARIAGLLRTRIAPVAISTLTKCAISCCEWNRITIRYRHARAIAFLGQPTRAECGLGLRERARDRT